MNNQKDYSNYTYFGAYNGYSGFQSNFKTIFDRKKFDRLFVIKGSSGSGKNTLIKNIVEHFKDGFTKNTLIYCSSDTKSLDGAIIEKDGKKFALIDATSPHESDAYFPYVIDEILDLGKALDRNKLRKFRSTLIDLKNTKANSYSKAYFYLSLAGKVHQEIDDKFLNCQVYNEADIFIDNILSNYYKGDILSDDTVDCFLISGFSKDGYTTLPIYSENPIKVISLNGNGVSEFYVMRALFNKLRNYKTVKQVCYSPFSRNYISAIFTHNYSFVIDDDSEFINTNDIIKNSSYLDELIKLRSDYLKKAQEYLQESFLAHKEIEKIYGNAMNFEVNNEYEQYVKEEIAEELKK